MIFTWFVYMHITLSKWLPTLDLCLVTKMYNNTTTARLLGGRVVCVTMLPVKLSRLG